MSKLTNFQLKNINKTGRYSDGSNLYFVIGKNGNQNWTIIYTINSKKREMGLGPYPEISLKSARLKRDSLKALIIQGKDPLVERDKQREQERLLKKSTFKEISLSYISQMECQWKNLKHRQQWRNTLKTYVYPSVGNLPIQEIQTNHIKDILMPIWMSKKETASRVRQRVEKIIYFAKAQGLFVGDNPACLKGNLEYLLPKQGKYQNHHPALPFHVIKDFMRSLMVYKINSSYALQFLILTAARTGEVIGAKWKEIDVNNKIWIIPRERSKTSNEHRIPLNNLAIDILRIMETRSSGIYIFEGLLEGKPLSNMAMLTLIRRKFNKLRIVPHGFRSTFRDWAETRGRFSHRSMEYCLGHQVANKTEAAYQRSDLLEQRKEIMRDWASFINEDSNQTHLISFSFGK